MKFEIPYYQEYISEELADYLLKEAIAVDGVDDLLQVGKNAGLETSEALHFLADLYRDLEGDLKKVLNQRIIDRKFIDERVKACFEYNENMQRDFLDPEYKTVIGLEDANGRIVIGPHSSEYCEVRPDKPIAPIPDFLSGPHVTLFGPPGSAKMAINAMNTYHRRLKDEPGIVAELLRTSDSVPKWGADDEDSKTPLRSDLVSSAVNLTHCFNGELSFSEGDKSYSLASDHLSIPIKRFPGLALPCTFLFYKCNPIPLHLYDFGLHLFKNWHNPKALVFYVPKLENEEEARYIHKMISLAEAKIKQHHHEYQLGTVRLMIVLENPRAILRTHEIIDELYPYFVGASLGWHDYLGSTARLFKNDGNYRIPVKADPDIVIKYIKASHNLLSDVVGSRGGIKVGGMYGILPLDTDMFSESFQVTIKGYIKDVVTQMKRNLTGFWVAHPDFVRLGLALVEAWKFHAAGQPAPLTKLVEELLDKKYHREVLEFIKNPDITGLNKSDSQYVRSLLVADIKESDFIANHDPEEIRYNVFQSLQYLTDWLCGNGCVALPAHVHGVAVRVMDDLATAERSRWEVWHEIRHGRIKIEEFLKIAFEELHFIRKDLSDSKKIVQVKWNAETEKWYPVAFRLMIQLMTSESPVEFATELLMPFTVETLRETADPMKKVCELNKDKFKLDPYIERFIYYFEVCGCARFASELAGNLALNLIQAEELILNFTKSEIIEAAHFHGNIGESKQVLDHFARGEQALVFQETSDVKMQLKLFSADYLKKFGMKFLISAKDRTGPELLAALKSRLHNREKEEIENAQLALWEISFKRFKEKPLNTLVEKIESIRQKHQVAAASVAISVNCRVQELAFGNAKNSTWFELASLSKTLASAFAIEYFGKRKISIDESVNSLFSKTDSEFRLTSNRVTLRHLMNHSALNMHYVKGYSLLSDFPDKVQLLSEIKVLGEPGQKFNYSGGGFIVLESLIEAIEKKPIQKITESFFSELSFEQKDLPDKTYANGFFDDGSEVPNGRLMFPAFAAGAMGTAGGMAKFLNKLTLAYHHLAGAENISHDTAAQMFHGTDKGCRDFMGCDMGLGVFVAEAGDNKLAIHQGANEGFRCLYIHCFSGPEAGSGFVVLCNADTKGVAFNAELAQEILKELNITGIDFANFKSQIDFKNISAENLVNYGYKKLVFEAFLPTLPEAIAIHGKEDPLSRFNLLSSAKIIKVSNQKFARAENMISSFLPAFDPELFGKQGKIMDSWESARHNAFDFDFVELDLKKPSKINFVGLSTKFHDGNQAEFVRILAVPQGSDEWSEILPKQKMTGHAFINLRLKASEKEFTKVKIEMYPDGGLTRVGLYSDLPEDIKLNFAMKVCERFTDEVPKTTKPLSLNYSPKPGEIERNKLKLNVDLASLAFGAKLLSASNEHYSPAIQLISPYPPIHMFDGLESSRSRDKNNFEEVIIELSERSVVARIILDFRFFVNNNPREVSIEGYCENEWITLVRKTDVKAFAGLSKEFKIDDGLAYTQLKLKTFPDGGINRLQVFAV